MRTARLQTCPALNDCVPARLEEDAPAITDDATGVEHARVTHDDAGDADAPGFGGDGAKVGAISLRAGYIDLDAGRCAIDQADGIAGRENRLSLRSSDDAFITDVVADQIDAAAGRGPDLTLIDYVFGRAIIDEQMTPGKEVFVADVQRAGDKASGIDPATGTDEDAGRVDQPDATIGREVAQDDRWIAGQHSVEYAAGGGRLDEAGSMPGADVELLPVDDRTVAVGDGENIADLAHAGRATDDLGSHRQCLGQQIDRREAGCHRKAG